MDTITIDKKAFILDDIIINQIADSIISSLTSKDTSKDKKCQFVMGYNETDPSVFSTRFMEQNTGYIFLSKKRIASFNPVYELLKKYFPLDYNYLSLENTNHLFIKVLTTLLKEGYNLLLECDFAYGLDDLYLIDFIASFGYETDASLFKNTIFLNQLQIIKSFAISVITKAACQLNSYPFSMNDLKARVNNGLLHSLLISEAFGSFCFMQDSNQKLVASWDTKREISDFESLFYLKYEELLTFIKQQKRHFSPEVFAFIMAKLEELKKDYYVSLDMHILQATR